MLTEYLSNLGYWDWFSLALLFLLLEVFVNVAFFLWLGLSAGAVGVAVLMAPHLGGKTQILFFAIGVVISMLMWRLYCRSKSKAENKTGK